MISGKRDDENIVVDETQETAREPEPTIRTESD